MSNNFNQSVDEVQTNLLNTMPDKYQKTIGYPAYDFNRAYATVSSDLYNKINNVYLLQDVDNLTGDDLTKYVAQRKGVIRKLATNASTNLSATGNATVLKGALFASSGNIQFIADNDTTIIGSGIIPVTAVISGSSGNLPVNSITQIPVTIGGLNSVTNETALVNGYDEESDDDLRARYYIAVQTPATSGNKYHYIQWALAQTGVGSCKVFPLAFGVNTVQVVIVDSNLQPANSELVDTVQLYIDPDSNGKGEGEAPIGAYCTITSATVLNINVSCTVTLIGAYILSEVTANINTAITNYLKSIAFKKDYVSYAQIGNVILSVEGVQDYSNLTLNSGMANITIPDKSVAVKGTVSIT